jgi:integrase
MNDNEAIPSSNPSRRQPWNKGKLIGAKPLRASHVWSIRTKLLEKRTRDLALFNLAIDSKLRGCDVVAVRVDDVTPNGYTLDRATVRQKNTGRPVRFELTEQTRQAIDEYLRITHRKPGDFLFAGRGDGHGLTTGVHSVRPDAIRHPVAAFGRHLDHPNAARGDARHLYPLVQLLGPCS